jgi:hypothetical protein
VSIWIRLGLAFPATEIAAHTPPTWETLADGGNGEASFELAVSARTIHPALSRNSMLEIMCGPHRVWVGRVNDYDRSEGRVVGRGIHADAYHIPALDGSGNVTRNILTALDTASGAPWNWFVGNPGDLTGTATGDSTEPQMVGDLFDEIATQEGKRWGQGPNATPYLAADPTDPTWLATPDAAAFGSTDEATPTYLVGVYFNGSTYPKTVRGQDGATTARAEFRDLTSRGTLTEAEANAILDAELAANATQPGLVNGVVLQREQLTTMGGTPAFLPAVRARTMMRSHGLLADGLVQAPWLDVVIGKTRYTAGSDSIYVEATKTAPRTLGAVLST